MIEIKGHFGDWKEVEIGEAFSFVMQLMHGITTTSDPIKKAELVDGKHLRGITVDELLKPAGSFVTSRGDGWIGIDYVSPSIGCTVRIWRDTDLGVIDRDYMMDRIGRMTSYEKASLIMRNNEARA